MQRLFFCLLPLAVASLGCTASTTGTGSSSSGSSSGGSSGSSPDGPTSTGGTSGGTETDPPAGSEYDDLFGPPANDQVTSSLPGTWASTSSSPDVRLKIDTSTITVAVRCNSGTIGIDFAASVTEDKIRVLESKEAGDYSCSIKVHPVTLESGTVSSDYTCFNLDGTDLIIQPGTLFETPYGTPSSFTKLSD